MAVLQSDGNFVLYGGGVPLRNTGTSGVPGPVNLSMDDTGNMVLRDANGVVRWQSAGTQFISCRDASAFTCDIWTA
jgi:hypothetical protein